MDALLPSDPKKLGGWTLTGRLGAGGMGVVYMGYKSGKNAAIKIILKSDKANPQARNRFKQEIQSLYLVKSPYVAQLLDFDTEAANAWYAVEYISDMSLQDVLKTAGKFSGDNWWKLAQHLLVALVSIHEADVVHRDLKPGNIMISNGEPKLIDFGLAKPIADQFGETPGLTRKNVFMGTISHSSPEQIKNARDVDAKTDIWAIGITLINAAGGDPWGKKDQGEIYLAISAKQLPDMSALDSAQRALVTAMLTFDPKARPDARTLLKDIKNYYNTRPAPAREVQVKVRPVVDSPKPVKVAAQGELAQYPGPRHIGYHQDNLALDSSGNLLAYGVRVEALTDRKVGTVTSVQNIDAKTGEELDYLRIRLDEGKVVIRSANKVQVISEERAAKAKSIPEQAPRVAKEPGILKKANSWGTYGRWWREYKLIFVLTLLTGGWALFPYLAVYYAKPTKALTYKQKVAYSQSLALSLISIGFLNPLITFLWMKKASVASLKRTFYIHLLLFIWQIFSMSLVQPDGTAPAYVGLSWIVIWVYGFFIYKRVLSHLKGTVGE